MLNSNFNMKLKFIHNLLNFLLSGHHYLATQIMLTHLKVREFAKKKNLILDEIELV